MKCCKTSQIKIKSGSNLLLDLYRSKLYDKTAWRLITAGRLKDQ